MGFDFEERKTFLYADLFKLEETRDHNTSTIMSQWRSPSWNNSSASDSSSSGFTTPFGSELGSSESEDGDFAAELSRQMAECMLHEEEEEERNSVTHSAPVKSSKYGSNLSHPVLDHANRTPCIKLENQSPLGVSRERRVKGAELIQQMRTRKTEQNYWRYKDGGWKSGSGRKLDSGSGMRAIFLGGSGSRNGSSGTGVFLPRVTNNPVEPKKKSGLSTVLIPTRVLEALELHFTSRLSDSAAPPTTPASSHNASPRDEWMRSNEQGNIHTKLEMEATNKVDEMQILPQEWTY